MRLLLDHHISRRVAAALRRRGYDVTSAMAEGVASADDDVVWEKAIEQGRVVVTYNYCDFLDLWTQFYAQGRDHPGLVLVYESVIPAADIGRLTRALEQLLNSGRDLTNLQEVLTLRI